MKAAQKEGPERSCVVTRTVKAPEDLIRFVAGPDAASAAEPVLGAEFWRALARGGYQGAAYVRVTTSRPDFVLQQLVPVAQRLGARAYFGVHEVDELALAVRRLMADVREVRV